MEQFLPSVLSIVRFTGMSYRGVIYTYDMARYNPDELAKQIAARHRAEKIKSVPGKLYESVGNRAAQFFKRE